jgi:xylan 1,4-beta-xylosidase
MKFQNPIIPGFYPDPSICRVEGDYYLVTSTFHYFPGVPVFHSTDLVNWKQIGHCLTRTSQLPLDKAFRSGGIYAPTIRYHNGIFYMVTTNVTHGGNFYVYTENPAGEWSEPVWVDQGGIDPSLFFDDDGKVYFSSTGGREGIALSEIDIKTGKRLTGIKYVWPGSGGRYPEAPHLYKIKGSYYLMIAEGGTEYGHMVTIARSDSLWGPYEACPHNPILTHRDLDANPANGTGHADLVTDQNGHWWMVFLAFRNIDGQYHHLGRETFLSPVEWNGDGWPVVNGKGTIELEMESDYIAAEQIQESSIRDDFSGSVLDLHWNFIRNPYSRSWSLEERKGWLRLYGSSVSLHDTDSPAFVGRRQQHLDCSVGTLLDFRPQKADEEAGLVVIMDEKHHYEIAVVLHAGQRKVMVRRTIGSLSAVVAEESVQEGPILLKVTADSRNYHFAYGREGGMEKMLASGECKYLSSEVAGGFTGVYLGMYATGNGRDSSVPADFDWFEYQG